MRGHRSDQPPGVVVPAGRVDRDPRGWLDRAGREAALSDALRAAGVELGAVDRLVLGWLAGWEPATVAVVASWVHRASEHRP